MEARTGWLPAMASCPCFPVPQRSMADAQEIRDFYLQSGLAPADPGGWLFTAGASIAILAQGGNRSTDMELQEILPSPTSYLSPSATPSAWTYSSSAAVVCSPTRESCDAQSKESSAISQKAPIRTRCPRQLGTSHYCFCATKKFALTSRTTSSWTCGTTPSATVRKHALGHHGEESAASCSKRSRFSSKSSAVLRNGLSE